MTPDDGNYMVAAYIVAGAGLFDLHDHAVRAREEGAEEIAMS